MERRLAAIVAADVVAFSRLMAADEAGTHATLQALLHEAIKPAVTKHGGRIVNLTGDGLLAEFSSSVSAVDCAVEIQHEAAKRNDGVPEDRRFRLRIGINLGDVIVDKDDIFGNGVNVASRLEALARPGGICISAMVYESLDAPTAGDFDPAGEQQLKNIPRPVGIFHWMVQVSGETDTREDQAHETALPSAMYKTNLPQALSSFLGRDGEIAEVLRSIDTSRLVTLTGTGGAGKTSLALRVAHRKIDAYRDGVWFIDLSTAKRGEDVQGIVSRTLDLREEASRSLRETLIRELSAREALLIFDNCEQVLNDCADLVEEILLSAPALKVLATSREPMHIAGEAMIEVLPLDSVTAVSLFTVRARQVQPRFDPNNEETGIIETIVDRLDGIPLAIELAAARVRMLRPAQILSGLDDRFRLLTGGARSGLPHHKTLEASIAWSYDLLEPDEKQLAARLSVLHGFTMEAAEDIGVADDEQSPDMFDQLARLVDKSLIQVDHSGVMPRFSFAESVRHFLLSRLDESSEMKAVCERHKEHFLSLAEELAPRLALEDGPRCLARLQLEFQNLEVALAFAEKSGAAKDLVRFVIALSLFYELRGHLAHGLRWFERALAAHRDETVLRARALWGAAHVCFYGGRYERSYDYAGQALSLAQTLEDQWAISRALNTIGVLQALSDPAQACESLSQSVEIGRQTGDEWAVADGLKMITVAWYVLHQEDGAKAAIDDLEAAGRQLSSRFFLAWQQAMVGYFARDSGDFKAASIALDLSLDHSQYVGDPSTGGFAEAWSAALDADHGRFTTARERLSALLASAAASGSDLAIPEALFALGQIELAEKNPGAALELVEPHIAGLRDAGAPSWAAQLSIVAASAHGALGDRKKADAALVEAEAMVSAFQNPMIDGLIRFERGRLALLENDLSQAEEGLLEALAIQLRSGLIPSLVRSMEALATVAVARGHHHQAAGIHSVTTAARNQMELARSSKEEIEFDKLTRALIDELGSTEFEAVMADGPNIGINTIANNLIQSHADRIGA